MKFKGPKKYKKAAKFFSQILGISDCHTLVEIRKVNKTEYAGQVIRKRKKIVLEASSIRAIAHEMVHVKQFLKHQLVESDPIVFWNGQATRLTYDLDDDEYWLSPWEMEARGYEDYLLHKWYNRNKDTQKS